MSSAENQYWINLIAKRKAEIDAVPSTNFQNASRATIATAIVSVLLFVGAISHVRKSKHAE